MIYIPKGYILVVPGLASGPVVGVAESAGHALRLAADLEDVKGWPVEVHAIRGFNGLFANALRQSLELAPLPS